MPELITRIRTAKVDLNEKDREEKDFFEQLEAICVDGAERSRLSKRWIDQDIWRLVQKCTYEKCTLTFEEQQSKVVEMLYAKDRCFTGEGLGSRPRWEPAVYLRIGQNPRHEPKYEEFGFMHVRPEVENWGTDFLEPEIEARFTVKNVGNAQYSSYGGVSSFSGAHFYYPSEPRSVYVTLKYSFN
jgi:hypothetical protein